MTTSSVASTYADVRDTVIRAIRHPALWIFASIWLVAFLLVTALAGTPSGALGALSLTIVLTLSTLALTTHNPVPTIVPSEASSRLITQLGAILAVILLTGYIGTAFHHQALFLPNLAHAIFRLYSIPYATLILNPLLYTVIPLIVLLSLGARWQELGFGPGWRSWRTVILWGFFPLVTIIVALAMGSIRWLYIPVALVGNTLQNGFFEEFLFRGALMTRLQRFVDPAWSIIISSLIFGIWHFGAIYANSQSVIVTICLAIMNQATTGLAFAIIFYRTRNLLASSVIHVLWNTGMALL